MERRKFNISAWAAVGLAAFLAVTSGIQNYAVTKYKADAFEKQAAVYRTELVEFRNIYRDDQRRVADQLSTMGNAIARIEQKIDIPRRN